MLLPTRFRFLINLAALLLSSALAAVEPPPVTRDVEFVYSNPVAKKVFLSGDFNDWNTSANPMTQVENGDWKARVTLAPGKHQYKFIADGKWTQDPANTASADDLFGGHNSVLVVNPPPNEDGIANRQAIVRSIRRLVLSKDFAALEKRADDLRTHKTRLPEGRWELPLLYEGVKEPEPDSAETKVWESYFATLDEWRKQFPESITEPVVRAKALIDYAWQARGTGWASEVHRKDWRPFEERLKQARNALEDAAKLPQRCPEWFSAMQAVALGQSWNHAQTKKFFEEAVKREPTYSDFYFSEANYLLPRWNGRPGEWERFAEIAPGLYDKAEEHALYARIAWNKAVVYGNLFRESKITWPKMRNGFRDIIKQWPGSYWNKNNFASFACMAGDHATANEIFKQIGDGFDYNVWNSRSQFLAARRWAQFDSHSPSVHALNRLPGRNATRATAVSYSPEAKCFLAGYGDGVLLQWQTASAESTRSLTRFDSGILDMAASPDGQFIACATDERHGEPGNLLVVDSRGFTKATIQTWAAKPCALAWSRDGSTLVAVGGKTREPGEVRIWNARTDTKTAINWTPPKHLLIAVALSPDGRLLMTNDDNNVRVWDLRENKMIFRMERDTRELVQGVAFSPDGSQAVAVCSRDSWESDAPGLLLVWKTSDWSEERRMKLDCGAQHLAYSPDGRYLAASRRDNSVTVWNTSDWSVATEFLPAAGYISGIEFSQNEPTLAIATFNDGVSSWQLPQKSD